MIKKFFSFNFSLNSSLLLVISFLFLYSNFRILDKDVYSNAFQNVDSADRIKDIIDRNLDNVLNKELKVDEENQFPPKIAAKIIRTITTNINFEEVINETWERNIELIISWLRGEAQFSYYIPKDLIIDSYYKSGSDDKFINDIIEISGYSELPDCTSYDQISEADYLKGEVDCGGPFLKDYIKNDLDERVSAVEGRNYLEGFLNSITKEPGGKVTLTADKSKEFNSTKVGMAPIFLNTTRIYAYGAIVVSLICGLLAVKLSEKPALSFLKILTNMGVVLIMFSLLAKVGVRLISDFLLWRTISFSPEIYNDENVNFIMNYLKDLTGAVFDKILVELMIIGIVLIIMTVVLYFIFKFAHLIANEEDDESDEDYIEEEDLEYEDEIQPADSVEHFENQLLSKNPIKI